MEQEDLKFFREHLTAELHLLLDRANLTVSLLLNDETNAPDPLDRASFEIHHSTLLRFRERESKLIPKILEALKRLNAGTFGICDQCDSEIGLARLKARPVATLCIKCKSRMENYERLYG
jgi:DnaK suppressor protein